MQELFRFRDESGMIDVPSDKVDAFRAERPGAERMELWRDGAGQRMYVPESRLPDFQKSVPKAERLQMWRDDEGKRVHVPESRMPDFRKAYGLEESSPVLMPDLTAAPAQAPAPAIREQQGAAPFVNPFDGLELNTITPPAGSALDAGIRKQINDPSGVDPLKQKPVKNSPDILDMREELSSREEAVKKWAENRNLLQRGWDYAYTYSLPGKAAQMVVEGLAPGDKSGRGAMAVEAVRAGLERPESAAGRFAVESMAPLLADLPAFALGAKVPAYALLPAMEFARQAVDNGLHGDAMQPKEVLRAGLFGAVMRFGPVPKAIQQMSGGVLSRVGKRVAGAGIKAAEAQLIDPLTGEDMSMEKFGNTFATFLALDSLNLVRAGMAGNLESRLRGYGLNEVDARRFSNYAMYNQNNPESIIDLARKMGRNETTLKQWAEWYKSRAYADAPKSGGPAGGKATEQGILGGEVARVPGQQPGTVDITLRTGAVSPQPETQSPAGNAGKAAEMPVAAGASPAPVREPIVQAPVWQVRNEEIAVRPDLMQFKQIADPLTGATEDHKNTVGGSGWDDVKGGNLLLWEPLNPAEYGLQGNERYILADGHGRMNFARSLPEGQRPKGFNTQILREADGVSASDAMVTAALRNIADGKGTLYDQAKALRNIATTRGQAEAESVARAEGIRGRIAAKVAFDATDDVYTAFINEKITGQQAATLAEAGAGDAAAQQFGLKFALNGKDGQELKNMVEAAKNRARQAGGPQASQLDLFGQDDTAIREMEQQAAQATKIQRQLDENIRVLNQALNRGGKLELTEQQAAALGITDRNNRQQISDVRQSLNMERERWERWAMHPDLVERVIGPPKQPGNVKQETLKSQPDNLPLRPDAIGAGEAVDIQRTTAASLPVSPTPGTTTDSNAQPGAEMSARAAAEAKPPELMTPDDVRRNINKSIQDGRVVVSKSSTAWGPVALKSSNGTVEVRITDGPDGLGTKPHQGESKHELIVDGNIIFESEWNYGRAIPDTILLEFDRAVREGDRYVFKGEKAEAKPPESFTLQQETPADVAARRADEERKAKLAARDDKLAAPMQGTAGDLGQMDMFPDNSNTDLFNAQPRQGREFPFALTANRMVESGSQRGPNGTEWNVRGNEIQVSHSVTGREYGTIDMNTGTVTPVRSGDEVVLSDIAENIRSQSEKFGMEAELDNLRNYPARNAERIKDIEQALRTVKKRSSSTAPGSVQVGSGAVGNMPDGEGGLPGSQGPSDGVAPSGGIKLPELWRLMTQQNEGNNPWVVKKKMRGDVLGRARLLDEHSFSIELLAKNARLTTAEEDAALQAQAGAYAEGMTDNVATQKKLAKREYDRLRKEVVMQRLDDPLYVELRFKTAAHEAVHAMDMQGITYQEFLKDNTVVEGGANTLKRGNVLGHVGGMIHYLKTTIPGEMGDWNRMLTPKDRQRIRGAAEKEVGPRPPKDEEADLAAWRAEVGRAYREKIETEYDDRGLVKRETIFNELEEAILWFWENKALRTGIDKLPEYYRQPQELFAEAGAWLILHPGEMAKQAPEFYQLFTNWRRARPEWDRGMKHIISELESGSNQDVRHRERLAAQKRADDAFMAKRDAMRFYTPAELLEMTVAQVYNSSAKMNNIIRGLRKTNPESAERIDEAMRRDQYHMNAQFLYAAKMKEGVLDALQGAGIAREDFNLFLEDRRNRQGRAELFNPGGENPISAGQSMDALRKRLGPERFQKMADVAGKLWEIRRDYALPFLDGIKSPEMMEFLRSRDAYSTVNVQTLDEDLGEWLLTANTGPGGGFAIRRAVGTMKDSMSPDIATFETDVKMIEYGLRQRFARAMHEAVVEGNLPHELSKRVWNADKNRFEVVELNNNPHYRTIKYEMGGQIIGVNVPRVLANMLDDSLGFSGFNGPMIRGIEWANRHFKEFVTKWTPGFALLTNRAIDYGAYKLQMPGFNPAFRKYAPQANEAAISIFQGKPNALAEMLMREAPAIIMRQGYVDKGADPLTAFLQRMNLDHHARQDSNIPLIRGLGKMKASYEEVASMYEMRTKIVGFLMLKEKFTQASNAAIMHMIQERSGSPNFLQSPAWSRQIELARLFYNPFLRGISATIDSINGPKFEGDPSRSDFILKSIAFVAATAIPGALLELFGPDDVKDMLLAISDYDKDNYIAIPVGWADRENWKVRVVRIPIPHVMRPMRALTRKIIRAAVKGDIGELGGIGDAINYGADYLPGAAPLFSIIPGLVQQMSGNVPKDRFGRDIYDPDFQGTPEAWLSWAHWTASEAGGSAFWRYYNNVYADPNPTWEQETLSKPIIASTVGRVYKVTNLGYQQALGRAKKEIAGDERAARLTVKRYLAGGAQDELTKQRLAAGQGVIFEDKSKWRDNLVRGNKERYINAYMANYYREQLKEQAIEQKTTHFQRTFSTGLGGTTRDRAAYVAHPELMPQKYREQFATEPHQ